MNWPTQLDLRLVGKHRRTCGWVLDAENALDGAHTTPPSIDANLAAPNVRYITSTKYAWYGYTVYRWAGHTVTCLAPQGKAVVDGSHDCPTLERHRYYRRYLSYPVAPTVVPPTAFSNSRMLGTSDRDDSDMQSTTTEGVGSIKTQNFQRHLHLLAFAPPLPPSLPRSFQGS